MYFKLLLDKFASSKSMNEILKFRDKLSFKSGFRKSKCESDGFLVMKNLYATAKFIYSCTYIYIYISRLPSAAVTTATVEILAVVETASVASGKANRAVLT